MTNKNESIEPENNINESDSVQPDDSQNNDRIIFEKQFDALMNGFGKACEEENVEVAIAIAVHPESKEPIVFYRGGEYDSARLMAHVLRQFKQSMLQELDTDGR